MSVGYLNGLICFFLCDLVLVFLRSLPGKLYLGKDRHYRSCEIQRLVDAAGNDRGMQLIA
jgi:hypothetical protein